MTEPRSVEEEWSGELCMSFCTVHRLRIRRRLGVTDSEDVEPWFRFGYELRQELGLVQASEDSRRSDPCLRELLPRGRRALLFVLWSSGVRRIRRVDLTRYLERVLAHNATTMRDRIQHLPDRIAELESRLRYGRVRQGPRKGEPLKAAARKRGETEIRRSREQLQEARDYLDHLDPDPMYAAGLYRRRSTPQS